MLLIIMYKHAISFLAEAAKLANVNLKHQITSTDRDQALLTLILLRSIRVNSCRQNVAVTLNVYWAALSLAQAND